MSQDIVGPGELSLQAYDPGRSSIGYVDDFDNFEARSVEFGNGTLKFTLPFDSHVLTADYGPKNGTTQSGYLWGLSEYGFDPVYRGTQFFADSDGCVAVICDDEDDEDGAHELDDVPIEVQVECWTWTQWFLSGRNVMTDDGSIFAPSADKADDVLKALLRANVLVPPTGEEPAEYAGLGIDREDFGSFTLAVAADTGSHATTVTWRWEHGEPLWDAVMEFCRQYNLKVTGSWSGTTYTLDVVDADGSDLASSVKFSRARQNLRRFGRRVDRGSTSNVAEVRGRGREADQEREYDIHQASIDDVGLRETGETHASANSQDATNAAAFIMDQVGGAETSYRAELDEIEGQVFGDFVMGDKVEIIDERREITVQDWITEMTLTMTNPGPPELDTGTGRQPMNVDQQLARSGGGGGGSRRGGGKPKGKSGDPVVDPDDMFYFKTITGDAGSDAVADVNDDSLAIEGFDSATYIRVKNTTENDPEKARLEIIADFTLGTITPTHTLTIKDSSGGLWLIEAQAQTP